MKFTNGYWVIRHNFTMSYATQCVRVEQGENRLHVLSACHPIRGRGDLLDGGNLDVTFTSPMPNVIRVKVTHFAGTAPKLPRFAINEQPAACVTTDEETCATFQSGRLTARVTKAVGSWQVDYVDSETGRLITSSGWRGMARGLDRNTGKSYMSDSLALDVGECVYGLGERFGAYVKNGQTVDMWNADGGTASELSYKNVPFYMTNRGYGVLVEDTSDVSFEVASEKVERVQFSCEGETLVYDVIYGGTPKATLDLYTAMTGRPALPPAWSFGLWLSTSFTTNYDEKTTSSFIGGMAERDIPLSVFHFDCYWMRGMNWCDFEWDKEVFPDPEGMLKRYHDRGLHICAWINPYIGQASPLFQEGLEHGYLLKKTNGDVWQTDLWQAGMAIVDVTNPAARQWYCGYLNKLMDMGVDCFKTDFGERIPVRDIAYYDGSSSLHMHNYYTFLYNQMVFDCIKAKRGEGDAMVFARSATAGGQQFPVHWGGDNSATYPSMAETLRAGLSMSHSGFGFWSHDISGFESTAPADVYKRWVVFGLLSSHSRLHGSTSYRVPWLFDEESCDVARKFTKLKCRLMPYLYEAAAQAHEHGTPMMRPMMLEFPDDPACDTLDRQYMLGEKLLVAPVFTKSGDVQYYLPDGEWTSLLSGESIRGGHWQKETHDFMSLPLMVRPGTVLPMGACDSRPDYDYADGVELHVYRLPNGESATVRIPDLQGNTQCTFTITMKDGQPVVETDSTKPYSVIVHE
ncbi:MAG: alpha-xylosidase [bacterium]|nr:alpha-xylosidase [bacterium]